MPDTKPLRKPILRNSSQRLSYGRKTAFLDLAELRTERKIISTIESPHSGKVIDTYQIVERKQSSYRSLLLHRYNLLTSQQQLSPPPMIRQSIRETSKYIFLRLRILLSLIIIQIIAQKQISVFFSKHPSLRVKQ